MHLNTAQPILATCNRVLMVTEEQTLKDDVCLALSLQNMDHSGMTSAPQAESRQGDKTKASQPRPELACVSNDREALALVETAAKEHRPFSMVIIDGRLFYGKDHRQIIRRLWQLQRDLQIVLHAVSQMESFEQIPLDLGSPPQLLVLKFRLVPFEITQLIRTLTAKHLAESRSSHNDLSLNTQILDTARRFEDVSNRLRIEQEHRVRLEEKLCRAQRLETLGRLADGIAHFFNNSLTVIQGHLGVALSAREGSPRMLACLEELQTAAQRAAGLTLQMVKFNHSEFLAPVPIRLEDTIHAEAALLRRTLGEQVTIDIRHEQNLPAVMADPSCLGQIILNLAVHAREAMPQGGGLTIQTRRLRISSTEAASKIHAEAKPGDYVVMLLTDTSKGMSPEELSKLFDASAVVPDEKDGRGIGMVLVQGLIRQHGGWVSVSSAREVGTEFAVHLPAATGSIPAPAPSGPDIKLLESTSEDTASTILVVDDEDSVRQVMEYVLTSQGHNVLAARDANEAWALWRSRASIIKLAIIDIRLPGGVSGFDLERAIKEEDPTLPVILTCGYSATSLGHERELVPGQNFLPKPFGMVELLNITGQALAQSAML
jgi:two-component system NtrC family sensor kinase